MVANILNCEDELIHFCGKIQNFGYLLVFDIYANCVAISENCHALFLTSATSVLNKNVSFFEDIFKIEINIDREHLKENEFNNTIDLYKAIVNNKSYQISVYSEDEHIFLELEESSNSEIDLLKLQELQINIENSTNLWQSICDDFYEIIKFDRIMVYQFLEDGTGIVVAESIKGLLTPVLGFRYPEFDIPAQARKLYEKNLSRQTPDIYAEPVQIIGLSASQMNLSKSKIRTMSPIHLQYLANTQVTASASFSIIIDNKLWGLVCCQHQAPKYINVEERKLCSFLINSAANKYFKNLKILNASQDEFIAEVENELKEKLFYTQNLHATLCQFANRFLYILSAKGAIIKTPDAYFKCGIVPNDEVFKEIKKDFDFRLNHKAIYTTHEYSNTKKNSELDTDVCSGIARVNFDKKATFSIYFFRPEIVKDETWAGVPEKFLNFSPECNAMVYSPRASFDAWKNRVKGESNKWSNFDKQFLETLHNLITDSIFRRTDELKRLDNILALIDSKDNESLQMVSESIISEIESAKSSAEYRKSAEGMSNHELKQFSNAILEEVILTKHLLTKVVDSALDSPNNKHYNFVKTENFITELLNDALKTFNITKSKVRIGDLYPVKGDKTLLHELFMNLIFNAVKFSSRQELPKIDIYSVKNNNEIIYYIEDNGIGMNTNETDIPFVIFKRLPNAATYEGDGVGLAVVKRIIHRLKANITFKSQIGVGTTFMITFQDEQ